MKLINADDIEYIEYINGDVTVAKERIEKMESFFSENELNQIKYALDHLHDYDLSEYGKEETAALESVMMKLGMYFTSQLD